MEKTPTETEFHGNILTTCPAMFIISKRCHPDLLLQSDLLLTQFACMQKNDVRYNRQILSTDTCSKALPCYL